MVETKNYISQYSGDQLDAAIAVLGSLDAMFISPEIFGNFEKGFDKNMTDLSNSVNDLSKSVHDATTAANTATAKAEATINKYDEIASQFHIIYEKIS